MANRFNILENPLLPEGIKPAVISQAPKRNILQKIGDAVAKFFGTDRNTKIQTAYDELIKTGVEPEKATEIAGQFGLGKLDVLNPAVKTDLTNEQKLALQKLQGKEMTNLAMGFNSPTGGIKKAVEKKVVSKLEPLIQEARKYKSAEEFVKAQGTTVYHGGSGIDEINKGVKILSPEEKLKFPSSGGGFVGLSTTTDKTYAKQFSKNIAGREDVSEIIISPNAKIKEIKGSIDNLSADEITILSKKYDVLKSAEEKEFRILNADVVKTKSQLTNIYNQSVKGVKEIPPVKPPIVPITKTIPSPEIDPIQKVIKALKEAKPIRGQQETIYTASRAEKIAKSIQVGKYTSGEKGFYSELGALKGEMPKVQFESIRDALGKTPEERQGIIDSVFDKVKNSPIIGDWEKITARQGLTKMFEGSVPTEGEIGLLDKVLGKEFTQAILDKQPFWKKATQLGFEVANIPRALMSSVDLSAPFRQGAFFIGRPKQFFPAFIDMFKSFKSEGAYKSLQDSIVKRPNYGLMRETKLTLTDLSTSLTTREEMFASNLAERIPVVGKVVRASSRAYTGFLNKLRADVFDDLINKAENLGLKPKQNIDLAKSISGFINTATGRGNKIAGIVDITRSAKILNSVFFSPRLMASRTTLLNPMYYITLPPFVRKEALKSLFSFGGIALSILGLAKAGGAEVGTDPRSSDFGKIKIGNTRIDIGAGFQQYLRMAGQLITGQYVSSTTGKVSTLGEGYKPLTRFDIITRQVESKEAPILSFISTLLKGQTFEGKPINVPQEIVNRFTPMILQDTIELAKDNPDLLPLEILGIFGVGTQTYKSTKPTKSNNRFNF